MIDKLTNILVEAHRSIDRDVRARDLYLVVAIFTAAIIWILTCVAVFHCWPTGLC